ncbi:MAG: ABC transporter permease [Acidobacteria bacterium]|nr:ABC transporter permease [Acidobacteriota bacterium]
MTRFFESVRLAVDSTRANAARSLLTILGIVVGVAVVVMVAALLQGAQNVITKAIADFEPDVVRIEKASFQDFNADGQAFAEASSKRPDILSDDLEFLRSRLDDAFIIGAQTNASLPARYKTKTLVGISVQGVTENISELTNLKIERGRYFSEVDVKFRRNVCFIGQDVVDELFSGIDPLGKELKLGQIDYEVIGVAESRGSLFGNSQDGFVQIPLGTFEKVFGRSSRSIAILVKARDAESVSPEATAERVRVEMRIRRKLALTDKKDNFSLVTADSIQAFSGSITGIVGAIIYPLTVIALFVGGVVVMNMMLASVAERTKEIGIRMALGAKRSDILMQFLIETITLTVSGGLIGILSAAGLIAMIVWLTGFPLTLPLWAVFLAIGVSCAVGIVFGVIPARQASKLDPIEALNSD